MSKAGWFFGLVGAGLAAWGIKKALSPSDIKTKAEKLYEVFVKSCKVLGLNLKLNEEKKNHFIDVYNNKFDMKHQEAAYEAIMGLSKINASENVSSAAVDKLRDNIDAKYGKNIFYYMIGILDPEIQKAT